MLDVTTSSHAGWQELAGMITNKSRILTALILWKFKSLSCQKYLVEFIVETEFHYQDYCEAGLSQNLPS